MTGFMLSGAFWGIVLILIGVSFIVKVIFNVDFPVWRVVIAIIFIALGLQIMMGGWSVKANGAIFGQAELKFDPANPNREFQVIFGSGDIDLTGVSTTNGTVRLEINTVFGEADVKIDPAVPARIRLSSAFANGRLPDGTMMAFGTQEYRTENFSKSENFLDIRANVVFGSLTIEKK